MNFFRKITPGDVAVVLYLLGGVILMALGDLAHAVVTFLSS